MIKSLGLIIVIMLFTLGFNLQLKSNTDPLFFTMPEEWKDLAKDSLIFNFSWNVDTIHNPQVFHNVRLLSSTKGEPKLFFSDIETPVCADGECRIASIKMYWNLLGNYVGYGIYPDNPLTKYDHDPFEYEDYAKLHQLLLDDNSVLKRKEITDLVDEKPVLLPNEASSVDIDAVSGATKKEIKASVVQGGLYSCYTFWHIVHGEVKEKMNSYLRSIYTDSLNNYFLYSNYEDYQSYALKQLTKEAYKTHSDQIVKIFEKGQPLLRIYILKKIPRSEFEKEHISEQFYNLFSKIDVNSRTYLIKRIGLAHPSVLEILSDHVSVMTKNQLKIYLKYLEADHKHMSSKIKSNLIEVSRSKSYAYNYLLKAFLEDME
ncbi:hypothetical protein [Flavivirga eckloniae]|uniref:Uncharacterized protein n=1 Tax=Flavivirga eckloniae TaxID=1803846 RepID=A0A2K9PNA9_9FLAO|nr:hypothetical protein [Flavivirga eckloniae]AUP78516.1 hypothetical protein C1H87_07250 [Flavivirga eckloniae]